MFRQFISILFLSVYICSFAQEYPVPPNYFRSPLDIPLYISGTFGEPRKTHFHTGLDIKTQGVEGISIYAIADGYVSRVKVSPFGYGNAIYITHDNGYVSVYAHLKSFSEEIEEWVTNQQNLAKSFAINIEDINASLLPVSKGQKIGLSGNTGGSGGPHLHFEIRDSLEHPINPFHFGYDAKVHDKVRPNIYNLMFYKLDEDDNPIANNKVSVQNVSYGKYTIPTTQTINASKIGIGVHTIDKFTGTSNKNGVYEIKMFANDSLRYHYRVDELDFETTKHVYSHCDYWAKRSNNNSIHKCFIEKGNALNVYPLVKNKGVLMLDKDEPIDLKIEVADFHGNRSVAKLKVQKEDASRFFPEMDYEFEYYFRQSDSNVIYYDDIRLIFPKNSLFTDLNFQFSRKGSNNYSQIYEIHDAKVPVADYFDISIKPNYIDTTFLEKYYIAYTDYKGRHKYVGGTYKNGYITTKTRAFGEYYIDIDTIKPKLKALNIYNNKTMTGFKTINFTSYDVESGIDEYNLFINGKWALLKYDAKRKLFTYTIDDLVSKGKNNLEIVILDKKGNANQLSYTFLY